MWYKNYIKILLWIVVCLSVSGSIHAQNISITAFKEDLLDQDARANFPRRDHNNQLYALIKIETALNCDGFQTIDFGTPGFGIIDCTKGIWVYAPAGATRISMLHNPTGSVVNYSLPVSLRAGTVYVMSLTAKTTTTAVTEEEVTGNFFVARCWVEGASIEIQGFAREAFTDGAFIKFLPLGNYQYQVDAPLYQSFRGQFEITARDKTTTEIQLSSALASVTLRSDGDIYINEEKKGVDLWTGRLTKGSYRVEVRKPSHRSATQIIEVEGGKDLDLKLPAPTPLYGKLQIFCNSEADIYIDGKKQNETAPAILNTVLIGEHSVKLRSIGRESKEEKVNISEGKITAVTLDLDKPQAIFDDGMDLTKTEKKTPPPVTPSDTPPAKENGPKLPDEKPQQEPGTGTERLYPKKMLVAANFSWSPAQQAYGFTLGHIKQFGGWYFSFLSNFNFTVAENGYSCDGEGYIEGVLPDYSGNTSTTRISATAGFIGKLSPVFALYAGGGYGSKALFWETSDGWVKNDYYSFTGVDIEGGVLFDFKGFTLSAGVVSTNLKRVELKVGIGFAF